MKFDYIIGNPPYQENDGSGGSSDSAVPVYNDFVINAKALCNRSMSIIMPSKWMTGGRGLDKFRKEMMNDKSIIKLIDFEESKYVFPGVHIDGGVCIFIRNSKYVGKTNYEYHTKDGNVTEAYRYVNNSFSDFVIRDNRVMSILEKVNSDTKFDSIVSNVRPFGIRGYLFNEPSRYPDSHLSYEPFDNAVHVFGVKGIKGGAKRVDGYVSKEIVTKNIEMVDKYKLFFTTSYSTNAIEPPSRIIAVPGEICTETFLVIGPFDTSEENINCEKYISTKLFKILLYNGKGTMHVTSSVFKLIPLQDFTANSDIDWAASIPNIDRQLYRKYGLTQEEIDFIETHVKEMV